MNSCCTCVDDDYNGNCLCYGELVDNITKKIYDPSTNEEGILDSKI